ncbi:DNA ligase [Arcobacter sp. LA11]|uniref:DNA ligase n=1 Tax=Arcobacter sp. LA11 TaxID=1898176 RepID=UPI00093522EC|nr:DNA ligase [Arcobacter sp. LA11]
MRFIILFFIYAYSFSIEVQKPKVYNGDENIAEWVMSEKLDGIRGYWTGKKFLTRKGKRIYAPKWFIKGLPNFELDGELWTKRDDFENIQNIIMDKTPSKDWEKITYNIFEVPNTKGNFFERLDKVKSWFKKYPNTHINIIEQVKIKDKEHLHNFLNEIISKKGEGIIVKDPKEPYHTGRSSHVLKVKKAQDMEGKVIGINISKKTSVLKSLVIKLKNGIIFNLGTGFTKEQRKDPPKIGEVITFKYFGLTKKGKPKFASFLHIRKD